MTSSFRFLFRGSVVIICATVLVEFSATIASAQPAEPLKTWNALSGNWSAPGNWTPAGVPEENSRVLIIPNDGTSRTITYDYPGPPLALRLLTIDLTGGDPVLRTTFSMAENNLAIANFVVGQNGRATFNQSGGTVAANGADLDSVLGEFANSNGIYNLSGSAALSIARNLYVGNQGIGAINQTGGTNTIGGSLVLGNDSNSTGTYTISGGTLTTQHLQVGNIGFGTLTIQEGGTVSTNSLDLNFVSTLNLNGGTLRLNTSTDANRIVFNSGMLRLIGDHQLDIDPTITALFGSVPTLTAGKPVTVEGRTTVRSRVNVNGGALTGIADLWVGHPTALEPSYLDISNGGTVAVDGALIGTAPGGPQGIVLVDGAGSSFTTAASLTLGVSSWGQVNVSDGAAVTTGTDARVGDTEFGTATVNGSGSVWNISRDLLVGGSMFGSMALQNQARVNVGRNLTINGVGHFNLDGGTLSASTVNLLSGAEFDMTAGKLHAGTFHGNLVNQGGTLAPGQSAGNTTILGNYTQQAGAALEAEIGGTSAGGTYDLVSITGSALLGGQLQLRMLNSFIPSASSTFTILNAGGGIFGVFNNVTTGQRLATVDGVGSFVVNYGPGSAFNQSQVVLSAFELASLTGDYNDDGAVDAADYTVWQDTRGQTGAGLAADGDASGAVDQGDYEFWKARFGNTAGSGAGATGSASAPAVPEPASLILTTLAALLAGAWLPQREIQLVCRPHG